MYNKLLSYYRDLHTSSLWSISGIIKIKIIVALVGHFHLFRRLSILLASNVGIDIPLRGKRKTENGKRKAPSVKWCLSPVPLSVLRNGWLWYLGNRCQIRQVESILNVLHVFQTSHFAFPFECGRWIRGRQRGWRVATKTAIDQANKFS